MSRLIVGTRGSDLALWQTNWVTNLLLAAHDDLEIEQRIITTHGDEASQQPMESDAWPVGGFVGAIEQALSKGEIDFAVHSYKDLTTLSPEDLVIAAVPPRAALNDVLLTTGPLDLDAIPDGFRVGTSSPRRSAQIRRHANVEIVPIRGNVPTRVKKVEQDEYDGVMLAQAGLNRLGIEVEHMTPLPVETFVPAPAQGAVAVQTKRDTDAMTIVGAIDDGPSHRAVRAERSFLKDIEAGCHTPVAALARLEGDSVSLHAQLFSDDGIHLAEDTMDGNDPVALGREMAARIKADLRGLM